MGANHHESGLIPHVKLVDDYASKYEDTYYHSESINMSMCGVIGAYVNSHLKMVKPRREFAKGKKSLRRANTGLSTGIQMSSLTLEHSTTTLTESFVPAKLSKCVSFNVIPFAATATLPSIVLPTETGVESPASVLQAPVTPGSPISRPGTPEIGCKLDLARPLDFAVFFEHTSQSNVTPVLSARPVDLVPIQSLCVDQVCVFFSPVHISD